MSITARRAIERLRVSVEATVRLVKIMQVRQMLYTIGLLRFDREDETCEARVSLLGHDTPLAESASAQLILDADANWCVAFVLADEPHRAELEEAEG